jgi:hypothetical protein
MAQMCVGQPCTPTKSSGRAGLSEIFQIEINNEGVPSVWLYDAPRLTV